MTTTEVCGATVGAVLQRARWLHADAVAGQAYAEQRRRTARTNQVRAAELHERAVYEAERARLLSSVLKRRRSRVCGGGVNEDETRTGGTRDDGRRERGSLRKARQKDITDRIEQLREREQQIAERLTQGRVSPESVVSSEENAVVAEAYARDGQMHAAKAHDRAAAGHENAAELHEHVASVLDGRGRPERAQQHREKAAKDRNAAAGEEQAAEEE